MKFITSTKQEKLERDDGKQVSPETITALTFSDLCQRVVVGKAWGFEPEESRVLIEEGISLWQDWIECGMPSPTTEELSTEGFNFWDWLTAQQALDDEAEADEGGSLTVGDKNNGW